MNILFTMTRKLLYGIGLLWLLTYPIQKMLGQKKKNLLIIMTDQQRYDALSITGNTVLKTPNIDRLSTEGAMFSNSYTACAVCCPARSTILTGHSIENTGMMNNTAYYDVSSELMTMPTFDEILSENGYHCEYYGKWHSSSYRAEAYKNPDQFTNNGRWIFGSGGQTFAYRDYLEANVANRAPFMGEFPDNMSKFPYMADPIDRYFGFSIEDLINAGKKHTEPEQHGKLTLDKEHTMTAFQARQTLEAIERLKDSTFSITCSFHFPHAPMLPAEPYYSMYPPETLEASASIDDPMINSPYKKANGRESKKEYADPDKIKYMMSNYYGLITEIDDWVGKILAKLDELGLSDNTMIIFTSDHGEMLGAHGMREKNVFYEESAHIPLIIKNPGVVQEQTVVDGYVSLMDLFPTILDYLEMPEYQSDGKSLRELIEKTDTVHGKYVVTEWDHNKDVPNYMVVKDGWKLLIPNSKNSSVINAMYDLGTDPTEMNNLLGNNPNAEVYKDKAEELKACLLEWLERTNSSYYNSVKARKMVGAQDVSNSVFVSQEVPSTLDPGQSTTVKLTMRNMGNLSWTKEKNIVLGSINPDENVTWDINKVVLTESDEISFFGSKTFTFEIKAPLTPGTYNFQWRMFEEGLEFFGASSKNVVISVGDIPDYLDDCDDKDAWKSSAGLMMQTEDIKQGSGAIEFNGSSTDEFKKVWTSPYEYDGLEDSTVLQFWYYVSDASVLSDKNQVELSSSSRADNDEYNWNLSGLSDGWNLVSLKLSDAGKMGVPNINKINYFRLYNKKTGSVITRLDAVQLVDLRVRTSTSVKPVKGGVSKDLKVYPNPLVGRQVNIDLTQFGVSEKLEVRIVNLFGQVIYHSQTQGNQVLRVDTKDFSPGFCYFVSVNNGIEMYTAKLMAN